MEDLRPEPDQLHSRDAALRLTRGMIAGIAAGAVGLSGALSVVAAQAFKGRAHRVPARMAAAPAAAAPAPRAATHVPVPGPESVPAIANDPAPLQPPAAAPTAVPQPAAPAPAPAPVPQVSGGS